MSKFQTIVRTTLSPLVRLLFKVEIEGRENIPKGPFILACNHNDGSDPIFLVFAMKKNIHFISKKHLFYPPTKTRYIIKYSKQISIDVGMGESTKVLNLAKEGYLDKEKICGIFPEGTTKGGRTILEPKTGVARLALLSKKPVLPIALNGTYGIMPTKENPLRFKRFPNVKVTIGKPMTFEQYYGQEENRFILKKISNQIMDEIKKMYKENYEDYENQKKKRFIEIEEEPEAIITEKGDLIIPGNS